MIAMDVRDWEIAVNCSAAAAGQIWDSVERAKNLEALIQDWITNEGHQIRLANGLDDNHKHTLLCIGFLNQGERLACAYLPLAELLIEYPGIELISDYINRSSGGQDVDEQSIHRRDERYGAEFNDTLQTRYVPFASVVPIALSYAAAEVGVAIICGDHNISNCWHDCGVGPCPWGRNDLGLLDLEYQNQQDGHGFFEYLGFWRH